MKRTIPILFALGLAASPVAGETLRQAFDSLLPMLNSWKARPIAKRPETPVKAKSTRYVHVSGYIDLNGSGFVPRGSGFVSVTLRGWTDIRDAEGRLDSGSTSVSYMGNFFVSNGWVNDWARPNLYISMYRDGKYVGEAQVSGSIYVSGHVSGGWINLSGSGTLSGDIAVEDP